MNCILAVPQLTSLVFGRTGYDGGPTGVTSTRVSRRAKDDTQGSKGNRDNYDLYAWSYNGAFVRETDYSMNSGATGSSTTVTISQLVDLNITQSNPATVAAYTDLSAAGRLYDYAKYYKTASGTINGLTQKQRLELGGVDGTTPGAALTSGGGGYLVYPSGNSLRFNPIFSSFDITGGTNALPFQVIGAQGPVNGTWTGTAYNYGDCVPAITTNPGALFLYAGTAGAIGGTATLDFGANFVNVSNSGNATFGSYAPMRGFVISYSDASTVLSGVTATTSLVLPTTGTAINTSGTITQDIGTSTISTTLTGITTYQGGFTFVNPLTVNGAAQFLTINGNNTFNGAVSCSVASVTLGTAYSPTTVGGARSTFNAPLNLPVLAPAVNSMVGTNLVVSGATANTLVGTGLDRLGANSVLLSGNLTATTGISGGVLINGASVGGTATVSTTNSGLNAIALTDYTASAASGQAQSFTAVGPIVATRARFNGNNATFSTGSAAVLTLTGCTSSGTVNQSGGLGTIIDSSTFSGLTTLSTPTTIAIQNSSQLTGGLTAPAALTVSVNNSAINGLTANAAQQFNLLGNASVGNVSMTSCDTVNFTAGGISTGTITNASKSTVYNFTNLTVSGTLDIARAPASVATIAPTRLVLNSGAILRIDSGTSSNLVFDCANVVFTDTTSTFARAASATGTIQLLNWPTTKTVPAGFIATYTANITASFLGNTTIPTVRVERLYRTRSGTTTLLVAGSDYTRTTNAGNIQYTMINQPGDIIGMVIFGDGFTPATLSGVTGTTAALNILPETNVDFTVVPSATDASVIGNISVSRVTTPLTVGSSTNVPTLKFTFPSNIARSTAGGLVDVVASNVDKSILRYVMQNGLAQTYTGTSGTQTTTANATTLAWYQALATGTAEAPTNYFRFAASGFTFQGLNNSSAFRVYFTKDAATNNAFQIALWVTDSLGITPYDVNSGGAQAGSQNIPYTVQTQVQVPILSPGTLVGLTGADLANIGNAASAGNAVSFNQVKQNQEQLAIDVKKASLWIPASGTVPNQA